MTIQIPRLGTGIIPRPRYQGRPQLRWNILRENGKAPWKNIPNCADAVRRCNMGVLENLPSVGLKEMNKLNHIILIIQFICYIIIVIYI